MGPARTERFRTQTGQEDVWGYLEIPCGGPRPREPLQIRAVGTEVIWGGPRLTDHWAHPAFRAENVDLGVKDGSYSLKKSAPQNRWKLKETG